MRRAPGDRWNCEGCGEPLVGALTKAGKVAPITLRPFPDGNVVLTQGADVGLTAEQSAEAGLFVLRAWVLGKDTAVKARENSVLLRRNHFFGCPDAERFRAAFTNE